MNANVNANVNVDDILRFWFPDQSFQKWWFKKNCNIDNYILKHYQSLIDNAKKMDWSYWLKSCDSFVAIIILLDQFTRNIYRGTSLACINDELALSLCYQFIKLTYDYQVPINYLVFALMPLRHSKNKSDRLYVMNKIKEYQLHWDKIGRIFNENEKNIWFKFKQASAKHLN